MQYYAVLDYAMRSHTVLHMLISEPVDLQTMADVQLFCIHNVSESCTLQLTKTSGWKRPASYF